MMDTQPLCLKGNEIELNPSILKEVTNSQRKELYNLYDQQKPIIIDYGSQTIKAGYESNESGAPLVFRPQISKTRDPNKNDIPIKSAMNLSYDQLDLSKNNFKSPFQKNIILHFSLLQLCNDYIFSQIVRPNRPIGSPIIISEPFGNPLHCRTSILEQYFECYQVNEVMIGVDALFAYFYEVDCNLNRYESETSLVINIGANTVHIFCIIEGRVDYGSVRRINVGGNNAFQIFGKTLLLKNPQLKNRLSYPFLRDIYQKYTCIAEDYRSQLRYFEKKATGKGNINEPMNKDIYHNRIHELNKKYPDDTNYIDGIEIDFDVIIEIPEEQIRRKQQIKLRMAEKLRETIERRKEIKKKMHQNELNSLVNLKQKYENGDKQAHEEVVEMFGPNKAFDKLEKKIHSLQIKLGLAEEKQEENKFSLIDIPDHELSSDKLKLKRIQVYQKNMIEVRRRKQEEKQKEENRLKQLRQNNPEVYLSQLRQKYKILSEKAKESERIKSELNNRKSRLKQRKMQVLAKIVEEDFDQNNIENEEELQTFKDAEDSDHYSELDVMEAELREIDPEWTHSNKDIHHLNSNNKLYLSTELIKCHEIYFDPKITGCNQSGLIQAILLSTQNYKPSTKDKLFQNVIVLGGGSNVKGIKERLIKDLTRETPVNTKINIKIGKGGVNGAFLGMQNIARHQRQLLSKMSYQKDMFLQNSTSYFVDNPWSNPKPNII